MAVAADATIGVFWVLLVLRRCCKGEGGGPDTGCKFITRGVVLLAGKPRDKLELVPGRLILLVLDIGTVWYWYPGGGGSIKTGPLGLVGLPRFLGVEISLDSAMIRALCNARASASRGLGLSLIHI